MAVPYQLSFFFDKNVKKKLPKNVRCPHVHLFMKYCILNPEIQTQSANVPIFLNIVQGKKLGRRKGKCNNNYIREERMKGKNSFWIYSPCEVIICLSSLPDEEKGAKKECNFYGNSHMASCQALSLFHSSPQLPRPFTLTVGLCTFLSTCLSGMFKDKKNDYW